MIDNLYELNNVINDVANRALDYVAGHSQSGQMFLSHDYFADLISKEDFLKYGNFIASELSIRQEVLEPVSFVDGELDINMGLMYLKAYQWTPGDEKIFGCSFEDWMAMAAAPVHHEMSLSRLADLGAKALEHTLSDPGKPMTMSSLGLTPDEFTNLGQIAPEAKASCEYKQGEDLFIANWRVHVADTGEQYGPHCQFVNDSRPIVEFFDMNTVDPKWCPNGQFTGGQYYVDTLLGKDGRGGNYPYGLSLQGDCPAWTVSAAQMKVVISYLKSFDEQKHCKKPLSAQISQAQLKTSSNQENSHTQGHSDLQR